MEIKQIADLDPEQANIEFVNLMNNCFDVDIQAAEKKFIKKHFQNPFGKSDGNFIYDGKKLIATNLCLRWEFSLNNKIVKAVQILDVQVHPDYQGQGIFRKGLEACMNFMSPDLVCFSFPNNLSKPGFLKWGWDLSLRYTTKLYPLSWCKFLHKRVLLRQKDFYPQLASIDSVLLSNNKNMLDQFFSVLIKNTCVTNFSYELLRWKLSLDDSLCVQLFMDDVRIVALLVYSIQKMDKYTLLVVSDFLKLKEDKCQECIQHHMKKFINNKSIDEIQYSGTDHHFFDKLFFAIRNTSANMIVHPFCGDKEDIGLMRYHAKISRFVTDHL